MSADKLPAGWSRVKFGDVVRKVSDRVDPDTSGVKRYVAGEHMDTDDLMIRRWGEVGDGYLGPAFHMRFKPGQVLYGSRRTYLRKVAVADFEGVCANTTFVLEPSSKDLLPEFLPLVMTTEAFHDHSIKQSKGSVNPYINFSDLTWYEFALPPLEEQHQIVEVMARCEAARAAKTHALRVLDAWINSYVVQTIAGAPVVRLGDLADLTIGKTPPRANSSYWDLDSGRPFCSIADMQTRIVTSTRESVSEQAIIEGKAKKFPAGSLMMSFKLTIGRLAFAGVDLWPNEAIVRIEPRQNAEMKQYLYWVLQGIDLLRESDRAVKGSTLNLERLNKLQVPLLPQDRRGKMIAELGLVMKFHDSLGEAIQRATDLRRALLAKTIGDPNVH